MVNGEFLGITDDYSVKESCILGHIGSKSIEYGGTVRGWRWLETRVTFRHQIASLQHWCRNIIP